MARMFEGAAAFNQPIGGWKTASVQWESQWDDMFKNAAAWRAKYKRNYKFNPPVGNPAVTAQFRSGS